MREGWKTSTLGETCEMYQPKTISGKEMVEDGEYPVYGANGVIGRYNQFNHEESQLLITCRGATCGAVNISAPRSWITGNAMVVRPKNGSVEMRFLEYLFRGGIDISKSITGAAQPQITRTNLIPLEISYPVSVDEQKRIVAILDEAFAGIATAVANTEKNLANARELFESYLNNVFSQKGEGWSIQTIEELCTIGDGNHSSRYPKKSEMVPSGVPFIRGTNLVDGKISRSKMLFISPEKHQDLKKGHLKTDDVLLTNRGEIGKVAIVDRAFNNANLNSQIAWLRCGESLLPKYLFFFLRSGQAKQHFSQTKSGTALQQFTIKMIKAVDIPLPPLPEQKHIVAILGSLSAEANRLESLYQHKLTNLAELKQSILHKAFSGELTAQPERVLQEAVA